VVCGSREQDACPRRNADADAVYKTTLVFDTSAIGPQIAKPHSVDNVSPIEDVEGLPIAQGFLGTCTNGRLEDFKIAASILAGRHVHPDVRFVVAPASRQILLDAIEAGYVQTLVEAGAALVTLAAAVRRDPQRRAERRRERDFDRQPQLQGSDG